MSDINRREYLAGQIIKGLISNNVSMYEIEKLSNKEGITPTDVLCKTTVNITDTLIDYLDTNPCN